MKTLHRFLRHLFFTTAQARRAFPADSLKAIQATIARGEQAHRAEVRLVVEPALPIHDAASGLSARQRARELFAEHGIWDTEENCGILVYINLADHKVEIIADRGVETLLTRAQWQEICHTMTNGFGKRNYHAATSAALDQLNGFLAAAMPQNGSRANELSNAPLML